MYEPGAFRRASEQELDELLEDPDFLRILDLSAKEVMRLWGIPHEVARRFVLSAIGEPVTMAQLHRAWLEARQTGELGLAKLIVRRRVIDLLRRDRGPAGHDPLPAVTDAAAFEDLVQRSPRSQLELQQLVELVRAALACFAAHGRIQRRQVRLLHRYALDEASYRELALELGGTEGALRVRVHKAMAALRRHIRECHPELEALLERGRRTPHVTEGSSPFVRVHLE